MDKLREKLMELIDIGSGCPDGMNPFGDSCESCRYYESTACHLERLADHLIANGVTVQEWISVKGRLPEDDSSVPKHESTNLTFATVLVCGGAKGVTIANRVNVEPAGHPHLDKLATNGWEWSNGNEDVTHWMPLPEPPKGE